MRLTAWVILSSIFTPRCRITSRRLFNLIGFDLLTSIKIVQTLGFVFAGFALYGWARRHFTNRWAAWLAAVAYVYAPFHLVNVYVRGDSLSEFYAFIFYPLILWSIDRIFDAPRNWPLLALSYGGLDSHAQRLGADLLAVRVDLLRSAYCVPAARYRYAPVRSPRRTHRTLRHCRWADTRLRSLGFLLAARFG